MDCSVIMPNHVHMIIGIYGIGQRFDVDDGCGRRPRENGRQDKVNSGEAGREGPLGDAAPTVSRMINQWKRRVLCDDLRP